MPRMKISDIATGRRHRKELGDVAALAASIERLGMLHPIVVTAGNRLVAGSRRLAAAGLLGWKDVPVSIAKNLNDLSELLQAECDENTCRQDFTPAEAVAMGEAIEAAFRPKAEEAKTHSPGRPKKGGATCPRFKRDETARTTAVAAKAVGMSRRSYEKAKAVVRSGDEEARAQLAKPGGKVDRAFKTLKKNTAKKNRAAKAAAVARDLPKDQDAGVVIGDFRTIAKTIREASVDLIFTDPPYDRKTLPLYGDLAKEASRVLVDGGSLICYLGQYQIHDVLDLVCPHVRLWWTLAVQHTGQSARMREYGVVVRWKPLLWFVKGTRGDTETFVDDMVLSQMEKAEHDWQQSLVEARYYIEKLCPKNGLVFDPFCGGGTTAVAAKELGRRWITCDLDAPSATLARSRVMETGRGSAV